jgi:hypothetical protein
MPRELEIRLQIHLQKHDHKNELLFVNGCGRPFSANKLREKRLHPLLDVLGIPRGGFHSMRHGAASSLLADGVTPAVGASATPSFLCTNHAWDLRACCRRRTTQSCSEPFDKAGELRPIVRKPGYVRKPTGNSLKTIWIGRGGGDRTHDPGVQRHNFLSNAVRAQGDSKFRPLRTITDRTVEDFVLVFSNRSLQPLQNPVVTRAAQNCAQNRMNFP